MTADIWLILIPVYVLAALLLVFGIFALLGRIAGGKYLKPIVGSLMKLPLIGKGMRKMERAGVAKDPQRAAQALSRLSRDERAAYLDATTEQADAAPMNRQMKRQMERAKKGRRR